MPERKPTIPDPDEVSGITGDVIGLYDSHRGVPTYVIADLTTDGGWLSVPADATIDLEESR